MSHKASNQVWGSTLSTTDLIVALALADICDDHGRGIYPSIQYAAWKSNLSERTVQRVIAKFIKAGILQVVRGPGRSRPTEYRMMLDAIEIKSEWISDRRQDITQNTPSETTCESSQDDRDHGPGDGMSGRAETVHASGAMSEKKGDSLSPITKSGKPDSTEKLSTKGDSGGTKGDSGGIKGDTPVTLTVLTHEPREGTALSDSIFRCPDDFEVTTDLRKEISRGLFLTRVEIAAEIRKFRIYPFERKVPDWSAKLCVWMARADEYKQKHGKPPASAPLAEPLATKLDPDAEIFDVAPPGSGETQKRYDQRIDQARTMMRQAEALARELDIDELQPGETLTQLNARVGTAQLDKLKGVEA